MAFSQTFGRGAFVRNGALRSLRAVLPAIPPRGRKRLAVRGGHRGR